MSEQESSNNGENRRIVRAVTKRPSNYVVAAALSLVGTATWLTAGNGGSACLGGGCLIPLTSLATLAAAPAIPADGELPPQDSPAIAAAVDGFHEALARGDAGAAMELLAADATIMESGGSQTRAEYAREHLAEDIAFAKATSSRRLSRNVRQEGNVGWSASTYRTSGSFEGKPIESIAAELVVLTRTGNGWRIRTIHWSSRKVTKGE